MKFFLFLEVGLYCYKLLVLHPIDFGILYFHFHLSSGIFWFLFWYINWLNNFSVAILFSFHTLMIFPDFFCSWFLVSFYCDWKRYLTGFKSFKKLLRRCVSQHLVYPWERMYILHSSRCIWEEYIFYFPAGGDIAQNFSFFYLSYLWLYLGISTAFSEVSTQCFHSCCLYLKVIGA